MNIFGKLFKKTLQMLFSDLQICKFAKNHVYNIVLFARLNLSICNPTYDCM